MSENHCTNPVEKIHALTTFSRNLALVNCICHKAGGFFVPNLIANISVPQDSIDPGADLMLQIGNFMCAVACAVGAKNILPSQVKMLRQCWDKLKSVGEAFVRRLEVLARGHGG